MRHGGSKRKKSSSFVRYIFVLCAVGAAIGFLMLNVFMRLEPRELDSSSDQLGNGDKFEENPARKGMEGRRSSCATVEQMGEAFKDGVWKESLRVRTIIQNHFYLNGNISLYAFLITVCSPFVDRRVIVIRAINSCWISAGVMIFIFHDHD